MRFSWVVLPVPKGGWLCCGSQSVWCQRRPAQPVYGLCGIGCDMMWHEIRSTRLFAEQAEHHRCHCAEREESGTGGGCKSEKEWPGEATGWEAAAECGCGRHSTLPACTTSYSAINLSLEKYYKEILTWHRFLPLFFVIEQLEFYLKICRQRCFGSSKQSLPLLQ